jgi:aerobic carbon-monoxide dehydrogenase medium subunit
MAAEVLLPTSPAETIAAFGDGRGITVVAGGTIVVPEIAYGRARPDRVLMLGKSGLAGITRADGVVRIGAATPIAALEDGDEPLATAATHVADHEIRAQATLGGNICAPPGTDTPRGDLQAPLVALGARIRSVAGGDETVMTLEEFLAGDGSSRLVVEVEYDDADRRGSHASVRRPHSHHYTILAVSAVRTGDESRVAVSGAGAHAVRATSVERALAAGEPAEVAAHKVLDDVDPRDDALASAWYRRRVLPTIVARALAGLEKGDE